MRNPSQWDVVTERRIQKVRRAPSVIARAFRAHQLRDELRRRVVNSRRDAFENWARIERGQSPIGPARRHVSVRSVQRAVRHRFWTPEGQRTVSGLALHGIESRAARLREASKRRRLFKTCGYDC